MIEKELFIEVIESVMLQILYDKTIGEMFIISNAGLGSVCSYNNSELKKSVVKLLQKYFPIDTDGFCEISHYLFMCEFGRNGEKDHLEEPADLYERLINKKLN